MKHADTVVNALVNASNAFGEVEKHIESLEDFIRTVYVFLPKEKQQQAKNLLIVEGK